MFVKNFEKPLPDVDQFQFAGLKRDRNYLLPYFFKYVAWFIVLLTVVSSSTVLIMYGTSFGMVKSYLWLTGLLLCIVFSIFVTVPFEIFIYALVYAMCLKRKPVIAKRKINHCILYNLDEPVKKERVLRFRQCNAKLYNPTPLHKLQTRLDNIRYNLELRNLLAAIVFYYVFLMAGLYLVMITKTHMTFYTNNVIKENILNSSYANGIKFKDVVSYKTFMEYLNNTLLPTLLNNPKDNPDNSSKRKRQSWDSDTTRPPDVLRKRQILDDFNKTPGRKNVFNKGWTMNPNLKLLGKPRLRQIRVKSGYCKLFRHMKARSLECANDLSLFNVESRNFQLGWETGPEKGLTDAQAAPWIYRSAWESGTLPIFSKFSSYPGGGYILDLARHIDDARTILEFLDAFKWVDFKTRAVFVEFTLYCANTNSFTVVTLIVEKPATGCLMTSYRIHTRKFIFMAREVEYFTFGISGLFCVIFFLFLLRETFKIHRTSFKLYIKRAISVVDLCLMFLGLLSTGFIILRSIYVSELLKKLEKSDNNEFISFIYADVWAAWSEYLVAFLIVCATLKLFHLSRFRVVVFQPQKALYRCLKCLSNLALKQIVMYIAFALFFNLTLVNYSELFKNFGMSLLTLIGQSVTANSSFTLKLITGSSFLCTVFFFLFTFFMSFLFVNMSIAVVCMYWASLHNVNFTDKYNLLEFIRHLLTIGKQNDILHLKEGKTPTRKSEDTVLRLRGGGSKCTKKKKKKKCKKKSENREVEEKVEVEEELERKSYLRDFVTKKLYDSTMYRCLNSGHSVALKNLMVMLLTENEELRQVFSEESLKALFYCYTADSTGDDGCMEGERGNYFLMEGKRGIKVYDVRTFERMKKVVEDWAKEKDLIVEEAEEMSGCDHLGILEEKLNLLERKLCSKYHKC